jgi:hypothetical protein
VVLGPFLARGSKFEGAWQKEWDDLATMPPDKFQDAAKVLIDTIDGFGTDESPQCVADQTRLISSHRALTGEEMGTSLLSIDFDVDTYLERGGRLLDLDLIPSASDRAAIEATADTMSQATLNRIARVGRFLVRVGELAEADAKVCKTLTEDQLRSIWRGAAPAVSDTPQ